MKKLAQILFCGNGYMVWDYVTDRFLFETDDKKAAIVFCKDNGYNIVNY